MRTGFSLVELLTVLVLMGAGIALLVPAAQGLSRRYAATGARERLAGLVATARTRALAEGGAHLVLDQPSGTAWTDAASGVADSVSLVGRGVEVELSGRRTRVRIAFDALGLGRVASQTVRFRHGSREVALVLSAYGGVRRR